jgi:peptide/nickel transport system permease protein
VSSTFAADAQAATLGERWREIPWNRYRLLVIGGVIVAGVLLSAIFAGVISTHSPYTQNIADQLKGPSFTHLFGTDQYGRDVFSRTVYASRISVEVASVAVGIGLIGGAVIGIVSAYFGGVLDMVLMRLMEVVFSFPAILLAVVLMAALGTSMFNAMIAIGIIYIPGFSRLARTSTLWVLRQNFIEVAHAIGMSRSRIILREILPNVVTPLLVEAMVAFAYAALLESALSFLGLGAQPPQPSWGNMLNEGRGFVYQAPWLGIAPGAALFLTVMGFNLIGDGIRDWLYPRLKD